MGFEIENGILKRYTGKENAIVIPDSVKIIGSLAFYDCTKLTSVTIPNSVTSIEEGAFRGCKSLTSITIPNSVTSIGVGAFSDCINLTSVTIPNSITKIRSYVFSGCKNLTSVTIPDSVTSIGWKTFEDCTSLTSITIPDSVTSIGVGTFFNCAKLKNKYANYKAFDIYGDNIICRSYIFKPNKWTKEITKIELCKKGYHFCTNLFDIFNYYHGEIDKDIAIYECEIGEKIIRSNNSDKCVTNKIKPVKRLYQKDVIKILNKK